MPLDRLAAPARPRHALGLGAASCPPPRGLAAGAAGPARRGLLTGAAATLLLGAAATGGAGPASAAVAGPAVHSTRRWGAVPVRNEPVHARPTEIVIHHMASSNTADTSLEHAFALARRCQADHRARPGVVDTGQHFTVTRGGHCLEGRTGSLAALRAGDRYVKGAHVGGGNTGRIGIECEGTYTSALPPQAQYRALVQLVAHVCRRYGIRPSAISGHRQHGATACPGDAFHARLGTLRRDVARTLATGRLTVSVLAAARPEASSGAAARPAPRRVAPRRAADPVLGPGSRGPAVRRLQELLTATGRRVPATGVYGSRTTAAVRRFQRAHGLVADGWAGPLTWAGLRGAV